MKFGIGIILVGLAWAGPVHAGNPTLPTIPTNVFNVTNYGALGNGAKDNTTNIQNAINAASVAGGGIVEVPAGTFLSGALVLASSIDLQVDTGGLLQMLPMGAFPAASNQFIYCKNVHDVAISGGGVIDGQGLAWWSASSNNSSLSRPLLLQLYSVNRLFIHDITLQNPPYHHCGIRDNGGNVTISNLTESAPGTSPNTDGIDFVATNALIENCHINVGDDNIALGSTGPLVGLVISNCAFGTGHGVSIGSTITSGITNLTVINCSFNGTVNGIRMKCAQDASAPITNLNYLNLAMTNVGLPIVIWTYYNINETPTSISTTEVLNTAPAPVNASTPKWGGILISNLNIVSGPNSEISGLIWGPTEWPITNVTLACVTNANPQPFELYNVYGVNIIDSQFDNTFGTSFTVCNAGVTISNTLPRTGNGVQSMAGATSTNSLAFYNANMIVNSSNLFAASPVTISDGTLDNNGSLVLPPGTVQNFILGTNNATIAVSGELNLNGTLNITSGAGFTATNYTLFTYTAGLNGSPSLGTTPTAFEGYTYSINTNTYGAVILQVAPPSPPVFASATYVPATGSLVMTGTGGVTNGAYHVLASTNVAQPISQWTPIASGTFDSSGNFSITNPVQTNQPSRFFVLRIP
jgi:polygalacturonase